MKISLLVFIIVCILALPIYSYAAGSAYISNVVLLPVDSGLRTSFSVTDAFDKDIEEAIKSGLDTSFTFYVKAERKKTIWFDHTEVDLSFKHTVKYDTLHDEYQVTLEEKAADDRVVRTKYADVMKSLMSTCYGVTLRPDAGFVTGDEYEILIKAELHTIKLPMGLDYVLIFVKLWDFETDWHNVTFSP